MAASVILKSVPIGIALLYAEENYLPNILGEIFRRPDQAKCVCDIPKAYAFVIFVNVVISGLFLISLGFQVGAARKKYADKVWLLTFFITTF